MDNQTTAHKIAAMAVALLLILTAMGNAKIMLICAVIGVAVLFYISRKSITWRVILAATMGLTLAISISLVVLMI